MSIKCRIDLNQSASIYKKNPVETLIKKRAENNITENLKICEIPTRRDASAIHDQIQGYPFDNVYTHRERPNFFRQSSTGNMFSL